MRAFNVDRALTVASRGYRAIGLLPLLSLLAFLAAIVAHSLSRLPGPYTWFEPILTFRQALAEPRFPFALLAIYWLGSWACRGQWQLEAAAQHLARAGPLRVVRNFLWPGSLRACALIIADRLLLGSKRDGFDLLALGVLGLSVHRARPTFRRVGEEVAYGALCTLIMLVICYAFTVSKALVFVPGREFDAAIVDWEATLLGFVPHRAVAGWAARHPSAVAMFDWVYFHCFEHMALTAALLVALRQRAQRTEYLAALALCYLLGGLLYHLLPARGPGYFEPGYFGYLEQPGLIIRHIRAWLKYNTDGVLNCTVSELRTWNYIACMPSLHITHELIMLYYSRGSRPAFVLSGIFTLLTLPSVTVLGWHYPLDVLAGALVAIAAIAAARWQTSRLLPACFDRAETPVPRPPKRVLAPFLQAYRRERRALAQRRG